MVPVIFQDVSGEEWLPYEKDVHAGTFYPPQVPEKFQFAIGHPFYGLLPGLFMYATIWAREHNRICDIMKKEHPEFDEERLFQTVKLIMLGKFLNSTSVLFPEWHFNRHYKPFFFCIRFTRLNFSYLLCLTLGTH